MAKDNGGFKTVGALDHGLTGRLETANEPTFRVIGALIVDLDKVVGHKGAARRDIVRVQRFAELVQKRLFR